MFGTPQKCHVTDCDRGASACCFCCSKNVCTRHFIEHIDTINKQIDPLANEINTVVEKVRSLTCEQSITAASEKLQRWRSDMHQLIDEIVTTKSKEIEDLVQANKDKFDECKNLQLETIIKTQDDVKQIAEDGDATFQQLESLKNQLASVETELTNIEKDFLSMSTKISCEGLVTVSSNLKKQLFQSPFGMNSTSVPTTSLFGSVSTNLPQILWPCSSPTTSTVFPKFGTAPSTYTFGSDNGVSLFTIPGTRIQKKNGQK